MIQHVQWHPEHTVWHTVSHNAMPLTWLYTQMNTFLHKTGFVQEFLVVYFTFLTNVVGHSCISSCKQKFTYYADFILHTSIHSWCTIFNSKQYIVHSLYCIQYSDTTVLHIMHHTILQCIVCSTVNHFYMKCLPRVAVCLYCSCVFVEGFRCCPKVPDGFRTSPPVVPVFPPCPRLGAGDLLPSMAFISGAAAFRLYLPSFNAFVWCPARRINRVRSAAVKRRAERRSLRWTERVQNTPEPHQTSATHHHHHHHLLQCGCAGVQRLVCSSR